MANASMFDGKMYSSGESENDSITAAVGYETPGRAGYESKAEPLFEPGWPRERRPPPDPSRLLEYAPPILTKCVLERNRGGVRRLAPQYRLYLEDGGENIPLLAAQKYIKARTPNYHIFDLSHGFVGDTLNKKCGNYLGKFKSGFSKSEGTLFRYGLVAEEPRSEVACVAFDSPSVLKKIKEGTKPRGILVGIPRVDGEGALEEGPTQHGMIERMKLERLHGCTILRCKQPTKTPDGTYRLHFNGRVEVASVKNFQLENPEMPGEVCMQFGKVDSDRFHLDFRFPLNAFQAFAIALSQFNY